MATDIPEDIRNRTYFHATSNEEAGEAILRDMSMSTATSVGG